jgi:hypothetical protein
MPPTAPSIPAFRRRYRGMNFAEVLFAVMILGIGFIMVAAIFPVAIQQSKSNTDETVGARMAESTIHVLQEHVSLMKGSTGDVRAVSPLSTTPDNDLWKQISNLAVFQNDPRYGQMVLYRAIGTPAQMAQVFVIPMQVQNRPQYQPADLTGPTFAPVDVRVVLEERVSEQDLLRFYIGDDVSTGIQTDPTSVSELAAIEGAFVVIADDQFSIPKHNGRIYRLGEKVSAGVWRLQPGYDMYFDVGADNTVGTADDSDENIPDYPVGGAPAVSDKTAKAFLIGRGVDPSTLTFSGGNQAINVFTALIPIPQ